MTAQNNAQLQEDLESVLALLGRSLLSAATARIEDELHPAIEDPHVQSGPPEVQGLKLYDVGQALLVINNNTMLSAKPDNPNLTIEVRRLINILQNSSDNAGRIAKYVHWLIHHGYVASKDEPDPIGPPERVHSVERWAVTMRDSLRQCAQILEGHDLNTHPGEHPASVEMEDSVQPAHLEPIAGPDQIDSYARTAEIYSLAKDIVTEGKHDHLAKFVVGRAERIMQLINPDYTPSVQMEEE